MFEHPSGLPLAYDGVGDRQDFQGVVFHGKRPYLQARELNDLQKIIRNRAERMGRLVAMDGDRFEGAFALVDIAAGTVTLTEGKIVVAGDVFPVTAAVLADVPMSGRLQIGVRLVTTFITAEDDPTLRGLAPGSKAQGDGSPAAREVSKIVWGRADVAEPGTFYAVYLLQDGAILDQTPPPALDGMMQALALYDAPHGNYIVRGCRVSTLGLNAGARIFSIEEGEANISGRKVVRHASLRHTEPQVWDVAAVPGETHPYAGGVNQTITLAHAPLDAITSILLTKRRTVNVTRGAVANGIDGLPNNSVKDIVSIAGYTKGVDFKRTGDGVDWGLAGAEPSPGSIYQVTFDYRESVNADAFTDRTITVSGGVEDPEGIIVAYTYKLPRIDLIGVMPSGAPTYIKGNSAANPVRPPSPANVLALAEIRNTWMGEPTIVTDRVYTGVKMPTWSDFWRVANRQDDHDRLIQQNRLRSDIDRRDPAAKRGMFVDPFVTDEFRDAGIEQNGAVGDGILQLAIEPTFYDSLLTQPVTLDWVEEVIVEQGLITGCELINPYQNFIPLPGAMILTPAVDFWTVPQTEWASEVTREFQRGVQNWGGPLTNSTVTVEQAGPRREEALPFLRQRDVAFLIRGFFPGEELRTLTFDGVDVTPAGLVGDANGEIGGEFTIPANITAGSKRVFAEGSVTKTAEAIFTGQGTLQVDVMRRVTTIETWSRRQESNRDGPGMNGSDPQAQIFVPPETRQLLGVDFHLCGIGNRANHILVHQTTVETGFPTTELVAEGLVPMAGAVEGWKSARYGLPVTTPNDRAHAFVVKTDDGAHAISTAALGAFDAETQQAVTAHPYAIGPRLSSVNALTWTAHQKEALSFRLVAARYPVTTKRVPLGTFNLVETSDLQIRAVSDLPSPACGVMFEVRRANGTVYKAQAYQNLTFGEYLTEIVEISAVLTGTATLSPILYAPVEILAGRIEQDAFYVTRAFAITDAIRMLASLKLALPSGSAMTMRAQVDDGDFEPVPLDATELSPDPAWIEQQHRLDGLSGNTMRIEIKLTGGPAARPRAADFGLGVI
ncbi:MAG: DUF4815 domain-containing protein [Candidatus Devosia phytovorans]|uniref:DUF4815 domain-containing protein n=1 Tax=Candidatus Devosia phytovorans TaxID=3121372 RepID=A0AAJ6B0C4_9HYPH|nr:DUF4815 domain-containing protein [Devosia sp.]WEK04566.1 MAG: DUF4815 domain-containing protein [Devosia sp.]